MYHNQYYNLQGYEEVFFSQHITTGFLVKKQTKFVVQTFVEEIAICKRQTKYISPMHQVFICKCGWLLYNPSTLPCGHTMCKHCADENMFCIHCGFTLDDPSTPNLFLVQLIISWFPKQYESTGHKKDAQTLYQSQDYELALNEIDISISLVDDDYAAYQIRAMIYIELKEYKEALTNANKSCDLNQECGKLQFIRGNCFSYLGKLNQAIDAFQLCLELEPEDMELRIKVINRLDTILSLPDTGSEDEEENFPDTETDEQRTMKMNKSHCSLESNECSKSCEDAVPTNFDKNKSNSNEDITIESTNQIEDQSTSHDSERTVKTVKDTEKVHGVLKSLIIEDDFECKLCYELLFKPVTTSCGHVFCKSCLLRSLDHNVSCPICRLSLNGFLKDPLKPVTIILDDIIELFFNREFIERKRLHTEKMERLSRVGVDESVEIPIFVCSIAFPYVKCPLHIFEPKYRLMIRECIESGSRRFGMCVPKPVNEDYSDIGTICEITTIQNLPDGRYIITATAGQRFIVQEKLTTDSMNYANVKYFTDEPEDLNSEAFTTNSHSIYDRLSQYVSSLNDSEQDCIFNALGRLPQFDENHERYQHGMPWVWWGLAALPLNFQAKLVLLRSKCVSERMLSLQRFLRFLSRMQPPNSGGTKPTSS